MSYSIRNYFFPIEESKRESIPAFLICTGLMIFVLFLGFGKVFISIGAITACVGFALQLVLQGPRSFLLSKIPIFGALLLLFFAWLTIRSIWAIDPSIALAGLKTAIYKGLFFFIAAMELARRPRYLKLFILAFLLAALVHGFNGIWQYATGFDFIKGDPMVSGRLTSSFSNYRVGNLIAMLIIPLFSLPWFMPASWSILKKSPVLVLILSAPFFLLIFAQARSGYLCVAVSFFALFLLCRGARIKYLLAAVAIAALLLFLGPERVSLEQVLYDGRIKELWPFAIEVFKEHPIIGVGVNGFNPGFTALGLKPVIDAVTVPHPHNIYLQLLCETGIIGFTLYVSLLCTLLIWGWKTLRPLAVKGFKDAHIALVATFWAGSVGYMFMAVSAHDFLRDWWFALAMIFMGVTTGSCVVTQKGLEQK